MSGVAESSSRRKSTTPNIAQIEAPHNPDEEEAYLREAIKASIATEEKRKEEHPAEPKMSAEAADLLIDFMDDFNSSGNTLPTSPAAASNEYALAPAPAQPNNQWAAAPPPPPAQPDNSWAVASPQPPAPAAFQQQQPVYDQYGGGANVGAFAAPPSNPFAPAAPTQPVQNYAAPPSAPDAFGAPTFAQPAPDAFAAPPAPPTDAFGAPPAAAYGQPAPMSNDPFGAQPPPPGIASPTANGGSTNVTLTMGSLSSDGLLPTNIATSNASGTMADMALQNLMGSIDSFGITGAAAKPPAAANNPFDTSNIMNNATLGEIKSSKVTEKKSVMNAPPAPAPGALVMAGNQGGNWGGYGGQTGIGGGSMMQQQQPQYSMSGGYPQQQPQMGYGQQPPMQQQPLSPMGMQQQQPMMQGQPPMQQQGYGAPPQYGQQPPMQQNQWGAPSY